MDGQGSQTDLHEVHKVTRPQGLDGRPATLFNVCSNVPRPLEVGVRVLARDELKEKDGEAEDVCRCPVWAIEKKSVSRKG